MSDLPSRQDAELLIDMTRDEAEQATAAFIAHGNAARWLLLEMHERQAHKALGYKNFEDFAAERLSLFYSAQHFDRLIRAARVERNILGAENYASMFSFSEKSVPKLPLLSALELAKLPSPELQKQAYEEIEVMRGHAARVPREYTYGLKQIVKRLLAHDAPPAPKTEPPAENKFDADAAGKPAPAPDKEKEEKPKSPVSSYTPPADPEPPEIPTPPEVEEMKIVHQTVEIWLTTGELDKSARIRRSTIDAYRATLAWMDAKDR